VIHEFIATFVRANEHFEIAGARFHFPQVVQLQRIVLPQIRRRRALKLWERVWELEAKPRR
jgi:hypothetical protein